MESLKIRMKSKKAYILRQSDNIFLKEKSGQAWISGCFIILLAFVLFMIVFFQYKVDVVVEDTQNNITTSTLGAMLPDYREWSLNGDIVLEESDVVVDRLLDLLAKNSGLEREYATDGVSLDARMTGDSPYYSMDYGDVVVEQIILYNYYPSKQEVIELTYQIGELAEATQSEEERKSILSNASTLSLVSTKTYSNVTKDTIGTVVKTPQEEEVQNTSIFIKMAFPMNVCGISHTVIKGELVSSSWEQ